MVIGPPNVLKQIQINGAMLAHGLCVRFVKYVKNLGVIKFDEYLSFKKQIMNLKNDCLRVLRQIRKVKTFLSQKQLIVNSIVIYPKIQT